MGHYVGLDVHSKACVFEVQDAQGAIVARGSVPTTREGLATLGAHCPAATPIALESGTVAFFVARHLTALGFVPAVIDAHEVRLKAHRPRQKSDRRDAHELCEGLRRDVYRTRIHVPPAAVAELRELLSRRRHFVRLQGAEINAAKRLLRSAGLGHLTRDLGSTTGWRRLLATLPPDTALQGYVTQHLAAWQCAGEQIAVLEQALTQHQETYADDVRRLQTIPGVGPIVALTTIATFSDVGRFPSAKYAASYTGLVPATYQSGSREAHGHITKTGSTEFRRVICEAAHDARRPRHPLHPYFARLCAKRGYKMAVVAVAHRLCRIMFAMLRDHHEFDVTKLGIDVGPFTTTVVRHYRLRPVNTRPLGAR
jgi:transposase